MTASAAALAVSILPPPIEPDRSITMPIATGNRPTCPARAGRAATLISVSRKRSPPETGTWARSGRAVTVTSDAGTTVCELPLPAPPVFLAILSSFGHVPALSPLTTTPSMLLSGSPLNRTLNASHSV